MSPLSLGVKAGSDMGIARDLGDICQSLALPAKQRKVVEFLTNTENAQKINGLVEDIHEALMAYQVCLFNYSFSTVSNLHTRFRHNKISTMRVVSSLWVVPPHLLASLTYQ